MLAIVNLKYLNCFVKPDKAHSYKSNVYIRFILVLVVRKISINSFLAYKLNDLRSVQQNIWKIYDFVYEIWVWQCKFPLSLNMVFVFKSKPSKKVDEA